MKIHKVLLRQLKRSNLSGQECPKILSEWQDFLDRIDRTYQDYDQDRQMITRSQEIATREMQDLYNNLNDAEHIAHIGSWMYNLKTNRIKGSAEAYKILGVDLASPLSSFEDVIKLVYPDDRTTVTNVAKNALKFGTNFDLEIKINVANSIRWVCIHGRPVVNAADKNMRGLHGTIMDITEQKLADEKIRKSESKYRQLVELSPYGIIIHLDERIVYINKAMIKLLRGDSEWQFIGKSIFEIIHRSYHTIVNNKLMKIKRSHVPDEMSRELYLALDGQEKTVEALHTPFEYEGRSAIQMMAHDISDRVQAENRISYLTMHDPMTELFNKKSLSEFLASSMASAKREGNEIVVVMFINIDRFRSINNTLGLSAGDLLLQLIAGRLKKHVKSTDGLGRLEGDQFVIILRILSDEVDEIANIAEKINQIITEPYVIQEQPVNITSSIGISVFPEDGDDPETLFRSANIALRYAKEIGGNSYQFCTKELKSRVFTASSLESKLRNAIANSELYLEFQPKVSINSGEVTGIEALVRWKDPITGMNISPDDFIPLAEEIGIISSVTEVVLSLIAKQMVVWKSMNLPPLRVAINLSPYSFAELDLINLFKQTVETYHLGPELFEIEITENAFFQSIASNIDELKNLKQMGIHVSIDDFGKGYSSLSYLQYLEIDTLKIDQSFIKKIHFNQANPALVTAIIAMAHSLGIKVVAEGVESIAELNFLREHHCDEAQGFYISRPLSASDLIAFIKSGIKAK